ncbi:MAG: S-layer homology domain-containing protein [Oscillospiraceae bacterium]|jgi:hypothetical protein|nr:S-layer homology domain-containing protein [Oscillospiraceae bacterium]
MKKDFEARGEKRAGRLRRRAAALLAACVMLLSLLPAGVWAVEGEEGAEELGAGLTDGVYTVPLHFYDGQFSIGERKLGANGTARVQFNRRALVRKNGDEYEVTLLYNSYSAYDFIQIVKPEKLAEVKALLAAENAPYPNFQYFPTGAFNCPAYILESLREGGSLYEKIYILPGFDEYYRTDVANTWADEALDTGYLSFTVPNLTDEVLIKAYSRLLSENAASGVECAPYALIMCFEPGSALRLPEALVPEAGTHTLGWAWTNVRRGRLTAFTGTVAVSATSIVPMPDIFEGAVAVTAAEDGALMAVFTLKAPAGPENTVLTIEKAVDRGDFETVKTASGIGAYWCEAYNTTFETIYAAAGAESDTLTLTYEDLAFGVYLRVLTEANNNAAQPTRTEYLHGWLRLDPVQAVPLELRDEGSGVTLSCLSTDIPGSSVFAAPARTEYAGVRHVLPDRFSGYTAFARVGADGPHYAFYAMSLTSGGNPVSPQQEVTLRFPIPDGWAANRVTLYRFGGSSGTNNPKFTLDAAAGAVTVVTREWKDLNADYLLLEKGMPDDLPAVLTEDGLYRARVFSKNANQDDVSMSAFVIRDNIGYIEVKGGQKTLYLTLQSTSVMGLPGWLRRMFYYGTAAPAEAEYLAYHATETGSLKVDVIAELFGDVYDICYPKRMAVPLGEMTENGYYRVALNIPMMDGMSGSISDGTRISAEALWMIHDVQRVEGDNPLAGYDRTVIRAQLDRASRLLRDPALTGAAKAALGGAVAAAWAVYDAAAPTSADIKAAADTLAEAVAQAALTSEPPAVLTLDGALEAARALLTGGDGYLETSYRALEQAVTAAETAATGNLTEEETAAQVAALETAQAALAATDDLAVAFADGDYSLADKTALWHYSMNQASMGHPAVDHGASHLVVEDGKAYVHLFFGPMVFAGTSGYLAEIARFSERYIDAEGNLDVNRSTLVPAAVHAVYEGVTDDYGPTKKDDPDRGVWYPKEISLEVVPGEEYTYVYVTVPVMGDSADQPARLRIDWSGFALGEALDMAALEAALDAARGVRAADCTAASYAALTAGIAAAEALWTQLGVTQAMVDARAAALDASRAALRPALTPEPPETLADGVYEVPYTIQNAFLNQPSMAAEAVDGPATVIVADGRATYLLTFKARVTEGGLRGHLLTLWNIPGAELPTGAPADYEKDEYKAAVVQMTEDEGLNGRTDYPKVFAITRDTAGEPYFYVRVDVDAMGESRQAAKIVLDWDEARPTVLPDENGDTPITGGGKTQTPTAPADGTYRVSVALWHQQAAQASMGNDAFTGQGLLTVSGGAYRLQAVTGPVNNSGYSSALTDVQYDIGGGWRDARTVETGRHTTTMKFDGVAHELTYLSIFEIDLKNTTDVYVPVRLKVPYTPMDEVTTDGWMYARLRIDWSTLSRNTNDETVLTPETPLVASAVAVGLTDAATGIRLKAAEGVLPAEAALGVAAVTSGTEYTRASSVLADTAARFVLYDIAVRADGAEVQPEGAITVHIPLPDGFDGRRAALYRINDDGTATLVRGTALDGIYTAPLTRLGLYALAEGLQAVPSPVDAFADAAEHWAYEYIRYVVEKSLFYGVGANTFAPDRPMTRAMFVTVLGRLAGADQAAYADSPFDDVAEGRWYAPYVAWARDKGIVDGVGEDRFAPDRAVTRQEMTTILYRYTRFASVTLPSETAETFADVADIGAWAREGVQALTEAGLIRGAGEGRFDPQRTATRAEAAALLARLSVHIGS